MMELLAQIVVGGGSIVACVLLLVYSDELSDGNVGGDRD